MPKRNFVREIKAENIKYMNPYDIIYLALKDGSIVLVADKDEETEDFEDYFESFSQKKTDTNFFNKIANKKKLMNTIPLNRNTNDSETNKNIKTKYSYYSKDKTNIKNISFSIDKEQKTPIFLPSFRVQDDIKGKYLDYKEILNKTYNSIENNFSTDLNKTQPNLYEKYKIESLDKSFDNINYNLKRNNYSIYSLGNMNNIYKSFKTHIRTNQRPLSTNIKSRDLLNSIQNTINNANRILRHNFNSLTPSKRERKILINQNKKSLINISNLNINTEDNSFMNRTQQIENKGIYHNYFDVNKGSNYSKTLNNFKSTIPIRSQSYSNRTAQTPKTYIVKRKEMEIMGRIVNDENSYRLIDHEHPNTLFEPKCPYCQNLARNNKLCISNIKEESIYDNHSFLASFGSSTQNGKRNYKTGRDFYKMI